MRRGSVCRVAAVGSFVMLGALGAFGGASAQDGMVAHPAHIHAGTCEAPGEVVAPLSDVSAAYLSEGTPVAAADMVGPESAIAPEVSETTVPLALADIVSGGHTIVIHQSVDDIDEYIACGDIGGMMFGAEDLPVGIAPLNDSGVSGIAWLHDNGDGTTLVSVAVTMADSGDAATTEPVAIEGTEVDVALADFTVTLPEGATFKVGETYTFVVTNNGAAVHELVLEKGSDVDVPLKVGDKEYEIEDIEPGTTRAMTFTFTEAGEFMLACHVKGHFEGGMLVKFNVEA